MALVKPVILQIVGFQNSGKTTFVSKLIKELKIKHIQPATIKHHGHGGKPEEAGQKDSDKHLSAGAVAALVEGDGRLILHAETTESTLAKQIELLTCLHPDVIIIEGHKQEGYPKILMLRDKEDLGLLKAVTNVMAIVYWKEGMKEYLNKQTDAPCFSINDQQVFNWLIAKIIHQSQILNSKE